MVFGKRRIPKHLIIHDSQNNYRSYKSSTGYGWIFVATLLVLTSLFISIKSRASIESPNDPADDLLTSDNRFSNTPKTGQLLFINASGEKTPGLHLESDVDVEINGMIAKVIYKQKFRNDTSNFQEGTYVFPLSDTAAINGMSIDIGERSIVGEIKERKKAKKIYQEAVNAGKKAALTEQQRANIFTQNIANISPGETLTVTITYIERVDFSHQEFSWRLPTTITPRYIPRKAKQNPQYEPALMLDNQENSTQLTSKAEPIAFHSEFGWAKATDQVPDAHLITPPMLLGADNYPQNTISISINLNTGLSLATIDSPYHDINIKKNQNQHSIQLANKREKMNRDFVLTWSATQESTPSIAAYAEKVGNKYYTMLMLIPPEQKNHYEQPNQTMESDRIFIIDTSGSMQGQSIIQAKESLKAAIKDLDTHTRFNIIEFNSNYSKVFPTVRTADTNSKAHALTWIDNLKANGGTEMFSALDTAMDDLNNNNQERLKHILFITDGSVGNESLLFELIHKKLNKTRLFTIGIGSAPNSYFMRKSAQFGRGSFTHIGDTDEIAKKMQKILTKINSVATKNITLKLPDTFTTKNLDLYPKNITDLYYGEPLLISSESLKPLKDITISGENFRGPWSKSINIPQARHHKTPKGISSVWARSKIESLEDEKVKRKRDHTDIKNDIINVGLTHKLVSKHTSFVAVEKIITRNQKENLKKGAVPNLTPKGLNLSNLSSTSFTKQVAYPSTATTAEITWWLGLFSMMLLILFRRMNDDEN